MEGSDDIRHFEPYASEGEGRDRRHLAERPRNYEELARSEERFRVLVENSSDLVALVDSAGVFEFQSPSSEPILGYRPEELVGRSAFDFIHPDDVGVVQRRFTELSQGRRNLRQSTELRFQHKDGSWRVLETKARKLPGLAGKVSYALSSRDVTDRKQMEQSLRLTQCSVERAADQIQWSIPKVGSFSPMRPAVGVTATPQMRCSRRHLRS